MPRDMKILLEEYTALSEQIKSFTEAKAALRDEIMAAMREKGEGLDSVTAGGYTATIAFRTYVGFNDKDETGAKVPDDVLAKRIESLRAFFRMWAPLRDIPASERIAEAWEAQVAATGEAPLPEYLKETNTPILRVSGRGTK